VEAGVVGPARRRDPLFLFGGSESGALCREAGSEGGGGVVVSHLCKDENDAACGLFAGGGVFGGVTVADFLFGY